MTTHDDQIEGVSPTSSRGPFCMVPTWVALAPLSGRAHQAYNYLRAYAGPDDTAFPSQAKLAILAGCARTEPIANAMDELEAIGAITRRKVRTPWGRKTIYRLHMDPPSKEFTGPRTTSDLTPQMFDEMATTRRRRASKPGWRQKGETQAGQVRQVDQVDQVSQVDQVAPDEPDAPDGPELPRPAVAPDVPAPESAGARRAWSAWFASPEEAPPAPAVDAHEVGRHALRDGPTEQPAQPWKCPIFDLSPNGGSPIRNGDPSPIAIGKN